MKFPLSRLLKNGLIIGTLLRWHVLSFITADACVHLLFDILMNDDKKKSKIKKERKTLLLIS